MKAILYENCGPPDVLRRQGIEKPRVRDQHVMIKVRAASVNSSELAELTSIPYLVRMVFGLRKPDKAHPAPLGIDVAAEVEELYLKPKDARGKVVIAVA
jgi:NADPH:quinone reductase-like Zn-dependent oxidoreductase